MNIKRTTFLALFLVNLSLVIVVEQNLMPAQANEQSQQNTRVFKFTDLGYQFQLPRETVVSNLTITKFGNDNNFGDADLIKAVDIYTRNNFIMAQRHNSFGGPPDYDDKVNRRFPELMMKINSNGSKRFSEEHNYLNTEPGLRRRNLPKTYQGIKTIGGKKVHTYLTADEWGEYEVYMFVTQSNHLVRITRHTSPFQGNKDIFEQIARTFQ